MITKDFNKLTSTFKSSITTWDYFVNWNKVFQNSSSLEIILNKLNYLLGKEDLRKEFSILYKSNPDIIYALPVLLAVRDKKIEIFDEKSKSSEFFDFSNGKISSDKCFEFLEKTGLAKLFKSDGVKNLVDYTLGVEVGLDTNGRKNRGGTLMERISEEFIKEFCVKYNYRYLSQATSTEIKKKWGIDVKVNKSERSFDFAVYNPVSNKLKLFEVNFYNGGGSKLKAVCGEFKSLYEELKHQGIEFIWITDGVGWKTAKKPLEETYHNNDYVFNLKMIEDGILNNLNW
jgi:hypothetical protein